MSSKPQAKTTTTVCPPGIAVISSTATPCSASNDGTWVISSMAHVDMVMGRGIMDTASDATMDSMNRSATGGPSSVVDKASSKTVHSTATSRPSNVAAIHTAKVDMAYAKTAHGTAAATRGPSSVAAINTAYATSAQHTASNKTSGAANSSATNANVACATTAHNSTGLVDPLCGSGRLCGSVRSDSGGLQLNMHPDGTSTKEFLSKTGTIINAINTCTVVKTGATTGTIVAIDKTSSRWTSSPAPLSPWTKPAAG